MRTHCLAVSWIPFVLAAVGACTPAPEGVFACEVDEDCPRSQTCHADGFCYSEDVTRRPDEPDDAFVDANHDGIDGVVTEMVFVSPEGDDTHGDGTMQRPLRTISRGIEEAVRTARSGVAVCEGRYMERVVVRDGISLYGGYPIDWRGDRDNEIVVVSTVPTHGGRAVVGLDAEGIHTRTVVDRLTIIAGSTDESPPAPGTSVYGVRVVDAIATGERGLVLRNLRVTALRASDGAPGDPGVRGEPSKIGEYGYAGGRGATADCGDGEVVTHTRGGDGGEGGADPIAGCSARADPEPGDGPASNPTCRPGRAGSNSRTCVAFVDYVGTKSQDGISPLFHVCGADVVDRGAAARVLGLRGRVEAADFVAARGSAGGRGPHGGGGPGGGGGGAEDFTAPHYGYTGGRGGGGNSGSCGGYAGGGGEGGGSSIGLLVIDSSRIEVVSSTFTSGDAGAGGRGGEGGEGGPNIFFVAEGEGANASTGGNGGGGYRGGPGGGGGGGAGGSSLAQLVCNSSFVSGVSAGTGVAGGAGVGGEGANGSPDGPSGFASRFEAACSLALSP